MLRYSTSLTSEECVLKKFCLHVSRSSDPNTVRSIFIFVLSSVYVSKLIFLMEVQKSWSLPFTNISDSKYLLKLRYMIIIFI